MGLTNTSTGRNAKGKEINTKQHFANQKIIALAGNPNVGKSTVFNGLTGMNQHTGNWPGKTVTNASGVCNYNGTGYTLIDLPGTYSLMAHSAEEEVARDFICFGNPDAVIVVCDATCLERNLNLVLQTIEITKNTVVCVNLLDEADKKGISVDLVALSSILGVPVVGTTARNKKSLNTLMQTVDDLLCGKIQTYPQNINYPKPIEDAISLIEPYLCEKYEKCINTRWLCIKMMDYDESLMHSVEANLNIDLKNDAVLTEKIEKARVILKENGLNEQHLCDIVISSVVKLAEITAADTISTKKVNYNERDRKIDRFLTSKITGIPIMLLLLLFIFWLTLSGANYPSQLIAKGLFWFQDRLTDLFFYLNAPSWLHGVVVLGAYRVLAWVVSVMLPPMAIFFPLFTLLEDYGYLPRVAFNLDKYFKKSSACGKQALTMCMGFGCNAAGVVGCRIIDSPRERLIATITNNFVPCNGRFPTLIAIITMFFIGVSGVFGSVISSALLTLVILFGILMTFVVSSLLSKTVLKGIPSSFTLELPPFRKPQIGKVLVRSIFDRTLFVLGRAVISAAPAGALIWLLGNITVNDISLLSYCSDFLDPFAHLLGIDGVILLAFILGFPANEIVVPIIIMAYMSTGSIISIDNLSELRNLLTANGWTWVTAINVMLFSLMHWPCATTCLTIKKETQSLKWTAVSFVVPTLIGMFICFVFTSIVRFFGI